jgi:hypothetical protein
VGTCNLQGTSTKPVFNGISQKNTLPTVSRAFGRVSLINHVTMLFPYMEARNFGRKNIKLCGEWKQALEHFLKSR